MALPDQYFQKLVESCPDIIISVEGIPAGPVANLVRIRDHLNSLKPGAPFKATVLRAGRVIELTGKTPAP